MGKRLIVGLGNPGKDYEKTRHNIGFMAIDELAARHNISVTTKKFKGLMGTGVIDGHSVVLLKPQTFMNLSGASVQPAAAFFDDLEVEDIIVCHDELDVDLGLLRLKTGGGHGGHNGLRDIIKRCGSKDFVRMRMGIGRPERGEVTDYVLGGFRKVNESLRDDLVWETCKAIEMFLEKGLKETQNVFHAKKLA
jgi:PTH1 family peptidyl-tRNA hydrolase